MTRREEINRVRKRMFDIQELGLLQVAVLTNFVIITQVKKINGKKSESLKKFSRDDERPREFC